jgi:chromosomal replication initiation ATPase DnaA
MLGTPNFMAWNPSPEVSDCREIARIGVSSTTILQELGRVVQQIEALDEQRIAARRRLDELQAELSTCLAGPDQDTLEALISAIVLKHKVARGALFGRGRLQRVCEARFELWWILHHQQNWTTVKIAEHVKRDHATIVWGIRRHQELLDAHQAKAA